MAKTTKTGNIAATGIQPTTTKEATVKSDGTTASQAEKAAKASSTATAKATSTVKSTGGSGGTGYVSAGGIGTAPTVNPYAEQAIQNYMGYDESGGIIGEFQPVEAAVCQYLLSKTYEKQEYK